MPNDATQDIVSFVNKQPLWQKDALRRLVQTGALSEDDYSDLFLILKKQHGIPLPKDIDIEAKPVEIDQLQSTTEESDALFLTSIGKLQNVNLIDQNETLDFCPGLTVVYGDNGTGKSGYTRMLKQACASRGQQDILANVYDKDYKVSGPATFEFAYMRLPANDEKVPSATDVWSVGEAHNDQMRRIRIYDSNVGQKLLRDNNDAEIFSL